MRPFLPALLVAFGLALAAPAPAVAAAPEDQAPAAALDPVPDDRELVDFVSAFVRLMGVQHGYMMLISQEPDPMRVEELKAQAVEDMEEAIQQDGMSVDRYNTIALAIREDPGLQGRVEGIIEQMASDPSAVE
ncbi:MAG: DUF4168 domain-containing protein [Pseudomonadota bacterium]